MDPLYFRIEVMPNLVGNILSIPSGNPSWTVGNIQITLNLTGITDLQPCGHSKESYMNRLEHSESCWAFSRSPSCSFSFRIYQTCSRSLTGLQHFLRIHNLVIKSSPNLELLIKSSSQNCIGLFHNCYSAPSWITCQYFGSIWFLSNLPIYYCQLLGSTNSFQTSHWLLLIVLRYLSPLFWIFWFLEMVCIWL